MNNEINHSFDLLFNEAMRTIDSDAYLRCNVNEWSPVWTRQFTLLNEYVEDPDLTPVPRQLLIDLVKDLRTKKDSLKTITYKEIYEKLDKYDYEYAEEFKENLLKYDAFDGHLTVAVLENVPKTIHKNLDKEFDFIKVDEMIKDLNASATGLIDSWSRDLSADEVIQKNVVILLNRSLVSHGQSWKDSLEHEMTHFIQRIVGLDKSLKRSSSYFGFDELKMQKFSSLKNDILNRTSLDKSEVDANLNRFIMYVISPAEHDATLKSCLNAFQREFERSGEKDRNAWIDSILKHDFISLFDKYFLKSRTTLTTHDEKMEHKLLFAILVFKIYSCLGYDMESMLRKHFSKFRRRDI